MPSNGLRETAGMDQEFEAWVETVLPSPEPDEGGRGLTMD
jgi:hypothetical protein